MSYWAGEPCASSGAAPGDVSAAVSAIFASQGIDMSAIQSALGALRAAQRGTAESIGAVALELQDVNATATEAKAIATEHINAIAALQNTDSAAGAAIAAAEARIAGAEALLADHTGALGEQLDALQSQGDRVGALEEGRTKSLAVFERELGDLQDGENLALANAAALSGAVVSLKPSTDFFQVNMPAPERNGHVFVYRNATPVADEAGINLTVVAHTGTLFSLVPGETGCFVWNADHCSWALHSTR